VLGLLRSKPSLLPLTSFLELAVSLPLTSTHRPLCRRIRNSLACSTGSVSPGRVCLLYAGPCTLHQRLPLEVGPSPPPQQHPFTSVCAFQGPSPPVTILPSYGGKLVHPSMRGGDGGKEPEKEDGTPNSASLCKITQAITEWQDWGGSLWVQVTQQPSATTTFEVSSSSAPLPSAPISAPPSHVNHAINWNYKSCFKAVNQS